MLSCHMAWAKASDGCGECLMGKFGGGDCGAMCLIYVFVERPVLVACCSAGGLVYGLDYSFRYLSQCFPCAVLFFGKGQMWTYSVSILKD